ncbi:hypothetical protein HanRHA438_Chr04g0200221 [Helianthus annuus]|nr:hypothetical protein HanRHA438_Chr04g0200221 [Helianthus annuus]
MKQAYILSIYHIKEFSKKKKITSKLPTTEKVAYETLLTFLSHWGFHQNIRQQNIKLLLSRGLGYLDDGLMV